MPKTFILDNESHVDLFAADFVISNLKSKSKSFVIALPTGKTPIGMYSRLVEAYKNGKVSFKKISVFNLDEYYPLGNHITSSFRNYLQANFLSKVDVPLDNFHYLDGNCNNPEFECNNYEKQIKILGGLDLVVLGIGLNGHIAFNEPGSLLESRTRIVDLSDETIDANKESFGISFSPKQALTVGVATILEAKKILMLVKGKNKKSAVLNLKQKKDPIKFPATYLLNHRDFTLITDIKAIF